MFENKEGQKIPGVIFKTRQNGTWVDLSSEDIFKKKTVVVFSLPGAFTPTCSSSHVPRYNQLAPMFKKHGVEQLVCLAVNDAFVMSEWQKAQNADQITFLPDGNGDFTEGMGLLVGKEDLGFGKRSWRYSMLVRDGIIEKMFIEPDEPGDPFHVSDADSMLSYLAPHAPKPLDVTIFSRDGCPHCARAKGLLTDAGIAFEEMVLSCNYQEQTLRAIAGATSFPQVFINGTHVGGADDLEKWLTERAPA